MKEKIVERVKELLQPLIEERGLKLVDIEYITAGKPVLRIYVYNPEGTSIEDCEWISRRIGALLDIEDLIPVSYILEVSSPGLDRKLKNKEEYEIFKGRDIKIVTKEPIEGKNVFEGILRGLEDSKVVLETEEKTIKIPLESISRANLEFKIGGE
ncbi:ribosome maturation factor RimP [Persephonella hydrogeniphila]|uniref:Ribosome maturation factor RimP n=1 Tax=Persephonella hydrogeniphila TaxID=198703 RepID=A0A285NPE9_9AQUI|nr:ribosome maturation factor RimP [Persephonella hydrogeniphila]SNZ09511.1 ribosome maturation factor RimP [Persephonella hydrogeniphila]